jgi:predicted amidohydrolase
MKLSLAQINVARANVEANLGCIANQVIAAKAANSDLVCLPEMCTTGFDWKYNEKILDEAANHVAAIAELAREHGIAICGSFLEKTESGAAANCFHFIDAKGVVLTRYRKLHLFTLFHEERHVQAGDTCATVNTEAGIFGAAICYDLRFPELFRRNTAAGALLHILPAAFPHPRLEHWRTLIRARAIENQAYFVAVNQSGVEGHGHRVGETCYFGHSMVVDPWGEVLVEADEAECLLHLEIDLAFATKVRAKMSAVEDRRTDLFEF